MPDIWCQRRSKERRKHNPWRHRDIHQVCANLSYQLRESRDCKSSVLHEVWNSGLLWNVSHLQYTHLKKDAGMVLRTKKWVVHMYHNWDGRTPEFACFVLKLTILSISDGFIKRINFKYSGWKNVKIANVMLEILDLFLYHLRCTGIPNPRLFQVTLNR